MISTLRLKNEDDGSIEMIAGSKGGCMAWIKREKSGLMIYHGIWRGDKLCSGRDPPGYVWQSMEGSTFELSPSKDRMIIRNEKSRRTLSYTRVQRGNKG